MEYRKLSKQQLVDLLIYQIVKDVQEGADYTVIDGIVSSLSEESIINFLDDEDDISQEEMERRISIANNPSN